MVHTALSCETLRVGMLLCPLVYPVDDVALDIGNRPHIILMLATFYEACQAGGVQGDLGVAAIVGLQPWML